MKTSRGGPTLFMCAIAATGVPYASVASAADRVATSPGFHSLQTNTGQGGYPFAGGDPWFPDALLGEQGGSAPPVINVRVVDARGVGGAACGLEFAVPEGSGTKLRTGHWSAADERIGVRLLIDERGAGKVEARKLVASSQVDAESSSTAMRVFSVRAGDFGPTQPLPGWRKDRWPQGGSEYAADAGEVARIIVAAAEGRVVELNVDGSRVVPRTFVGIPRLDSASLAQLRGCFAQLAAAR